MTPFSVYNIEGRILRSGVCQDENLSAQARAEEFVVKGQYNNSTHWMDEGVPALRPVLSLPATHALAVNADWTLDSIPTGTKVFTDGVHIGTTDGSALDVSFPAIDTWILRLVPPFPYIEAICEVTVT